MSGVLWREMSRHFRTARVRDARRGSRRTPPQACLPSEQRASGTPLKALAVYASAGVPPFRTASVRDAREGGSRVRLCGRASLPNSGGQGRQRRGSRVRLCGRASLMRTVVSLMRTIAPMRTVASRQADHCPPCDCRRPHADHRPPCGPSPPAMRTVASRQADRRLPPCGRSPSMRTVASPPRRGVMAPVRTRSVLSCGNEVGRGAGPVLMSPGRFVTRECRREEPPP